MSKNKLFYTFMAVTILGGVLCHARDRMSLNGTTTPNATEKVAVSFAKDIRFKKPLCGVNIVSLAGSILLLCSLKDRRKKNETKA
jgi:hypothetical protein